MSKSAGNTSPTVRRYGHKTAVDGTTSGAEAVAGVETALLARTIVAVLKAGDAILFGTTRDGGAVVMQLFSGDATDKLYAAHATELEDHLTDVIAVAEG